MRSKASFSFSTYLFEHFRRTRWPAAFGISVGLLATPVCSFVKPLVGWAGLSFGWAAASGAAALAACIYVLIVTVRFCCGKALRDEERSWLSGTVYTATLTLVPVGMLLAVEWFSPPCGLLAEIVPKLRDEQARWLGVDYRLAPGDAGSDSTTVNTITDSVGLSENDAQNPFQLEPEIVIDENPFQLEERNRDDTN